MGQTVKIYDRSEFPKVFPEMGLNGIYVEVGVDKGDYSRWFLPSLDAGLIKKLVLVDAWDKNLYYKPITCSEMDAIYNDVCKLRIGREDRLDVICGRSVESSRLFGDGTLDFVYHDTSHEYVATTHELGAWWHKVRDGGVFAGHDIDMPDVRRAVDEFVGSLGIKYTEVESHYDPSWYIIKEEAT